jgi:AraC-like DNA-binding protein
VQQVHCFAGLIEVAIPVMMGRRHVATLMSGQVFLREPAQCDFEQAVKALNHKPDKEWEKKAREAYFQTPLISPERFQAITELIIVFARLLSDEAGRHAIAFSDMEPKAVGSAKKYVQSHSDESITLRHVLRHVHVSRFYFCKIFKKTTGITLTEYVARVRVEKATKLLGDPRLRISEVAFAAGFGSIPQFNSVFKRVAGMPPTEYRFALRQQQAVSPLEG